MRNRAVLLFSAVFACAARAAALEVTKAVPAIKPASAAGPLTFSGVIEVKGISLRKNAVVMPVTEYKGRVYGDIKLLSKSLYAGIEACLAGGVCANASGAEPKISVAGVRFLKSKTRLANAEVVFDGELLVVAGVMASSREPGELWIAWPEPFKIKNAALKARTERLIRDAYAENLKKPEKKQ